MKTTTKIILSLIVPVFAAAACKSQETPPPETKPVAVAPVEKKVEPPKPVGQIGAGNQLYQKGDYKGAVQTYDQILSQEPDNDTAAFNRAVALQKAGDFA